MKQAILHNRQQETMDAKTRWFRSLSMAERMEVFCSFTELVMSANPGLKERINAQPTTGRIQVISAARG